MSVEPLTRASLLVRLRDPRDRAAWQEFVDLYSPVVYGFARKRGLQDADAADLMQDVLRAIVRSAGKLDYDPGRGTFRGWLFTITRNKIYNFLESQRLRPRGSGDTDAQMRLEEQAQPADHEEWDHEIERQLVSMGMQRIQRDFQPATWAAFLGTAVEGKSAAQVASEVGLSVGAVYVARSRVLARLKDIIQQLREEQ